MSAAAAALAASGLPLPPPLQMPAAQSPPMSAIQAWAAAVAANDYIRAKLLREQQEQLAKQLQAQGRGEEGSEEEDEAMDNNVDEDVVEEKEDSKEQEEKSQSH